MKFDKEDPISMSFITIIVSFIIIVGILYLVNPSFCHTVDTITGRKTIVWSILLSSASIFAFLLSIIVLIVLSSQRVQTFPDKKNGIIAHVVEPSFDN
jgi:hypothetical protein